MNIIKSIISVMILPVACIIMLQACNISSKADNPVTVIKVDPKANRCSPDDIFDSFSYTFLETNDSILMPMIERIDIDENHILITSRTEIFLFNRDGSFLSRIQTLSKIVVQLYDYLSCH